MLVPPQQPRVLGTSASGAAAGVRHALTSLRDYQAKGKSDIYSAWQQGNDNVLFVLPTGGGKCLGKDTPVLMFDGSIKPVQDVKQGDLLMGPDSKPRNVLTTCTGKEMLYRVTPVKGDPYVVNESHILSLKQTGLSSKPKYKSQEGKGRVVNVGVKDYLASSANFKHTHKGWRSAVNWHHKKIDEALPPYLLGLWLGDGTSRGPSITTADPEIADYLEDWADLFCMGFRVEEQKDNASKIYHLTDNGAKRDTLRKSLRKYGLLQNKRVPHDYKTGSRTQRLGLLAGLIDADGALHNGGFDVVLKNKKLAEDAVFVARSLGFSCYIKECQKTCTNNGKTGTYYRFCIDGDTWKIPTILPHKRAPMRKQKKDPLVTGLRSVEPIGVGDYYGFEIDGDRLFMLGDFTVTHNTVILSHIVLEEAGASVVMAHRRELIAQISIALARNGVKHRILAPNNVIRQIIKSHVDELGVSYYDPSAKTGVASVDTVEARMKKASAADLAWANNISLWIQDEAHHVLKGNKWGRAIERFPNAKGLGVTATPCRADGRGLGRHASGLFDVLVEGPTMRWLISEGYLTDYRIVCPPNNLDMSDANKGSDNDYTKASMTKAVKRSSIMGDVVKHYMRFVRGKRGVTFVPDVETASETALKFKQQGIPAEALSAKSKDSVRGHSVKRLASAELLQLVNVDLFGEGFDLPAIDVVSFARPTLSYSLFAQQFGRVLRPMYAPGYDLSTREGRLAAIANGPKPVAWVIDHVGNVMAHGGPPDKIRAWTLDDRAKRGKGGPNDKIPVTVCLNPVCMAPYEKFEPVCPFCGEAKPEPSRRDGPEFVDGDLVELDEETLKRMRGEEVNTDATVEEVKRQVIDDRTPAIAQNKVLQSRLDTQIAQKKLRKAMAWWSGWQKANGLDTNSKREQKFYWTFGIDVSSARALKRPDAEELLERIYKHMGVEESVD